MLGYIRNLLSGGSSNESSRPNKEQKIQVATCALLMEIAAADDHFSEPEKNKIIDIMKNTFNLSSEYVEELIEITREKISSSVSIYEFTDTINLNFTREEKLEVLLNIWRLIFVDDVMDKYEEFLVRRIAGNLKLEHSDLIQSKMEARAERKHK